MPELPDLTVYAMNLKKRVLDRPVADAIVVHAGRINVTPAALHTALAGASIADIERTGKELLFRLTNGKAFSIHLMLGGKFHTGQAAEAGDISGRILTIAFGDKSALTMSDPSKLLRFTMNPKPSAVPDVCADEFDEKYFQKKARAFAWLNVKAFLIDQKIMRGIGNAYADEILYRANISPENYVGRIPEAALLELYAAIRPVLAEAVDSILAACPDIVGGEERGFLKVHNPGKTVTEGGDPILVKEIAEKKTYYTAKQRRFR